MVRKSDTFFGNTGIPLVFSVFNDVSYIRFPLEVECEHDAHYTYQACGLTENTIAPH